MPRHYIEVPSTSTQYLAYAPPPPECPWFYMNVFTCLAGLPLYWIFGGKKQWNQAIEQEVEKRLKARQATVPVPSPSTQPKPISQSSANIKQMEAQLIMLLQGDRDAAMRLVKHVKAQHPTQPATWCWEKAIEDLKRDRL